MKKHIILGVTGSIAAYKSPELAARLAEAGAQVSVVMTEEAARFVTPLTLATLARGRVYQAMFEAPEAWDVEHVALADAAHLVLIAPATANIIGKLAAGICDDLLTCTVAATSAPVLLAPAMNDRMWRHPAAASNVERLKKFGYHFVGPAAGRLACGREGVGRMSAVDAIVERALKLAR